MKWFRVDVGITSNKRVDNLAHTLGLGVYETVGRLIAFWEAISQWAEDGNLADVSPRLLESWSDWRGDEGVFYQALVSNGFIEENNKEVHGWKERQEPIIKSRKRWAMWRKKQKSANGSANADTNGSATKAQRKGKRSANAYSHPHPHPPSDDSSTKAAAAAGPKKSAKKETNPNVALAIRGYYDRHLAATGEKPFINGGQIGTLAATALEVLSIEEIYALQDLYFAEFQDGTNSFFADPTPGHFFSAGVLDKLRAILRRRGGWERPAAASPLHVTLTTALALRLGVHATFDGRPCTIVGTDHGRVNALFPGEGVADLVAALAGTPPEDVGKRVAVVQEAGA